ncbi:inhibin beta A chain-like [Centruroides sculpturatus]|uniref:inhibin beta A chain-like n=1 Tax=Centruroides sculpturatus TaxID=218467 RepID=UPI000C6CF389|nr:inhibin beta A chain-like [Centruroides sculpturatus]
MSQSHRAIFLSFLAIFITISHQNSIRNRRDKEECPTCVGNKQSNEEISEEEEKLMRTALIQLQILKTLKLEEPPKFNDNISNYFRNLMKNVNLENGQDEFKQYRSLSERRVSKVETKTIIVFPDEINDKSFSKYPAVTLYFNFTSRTLPKGSVSAQLWFYKTKTDKEAIQFGITEVVESSKATIDYVYSKHDIKDFTDARRAKWMKADVFSYLPEWFENPNDTHRIEISCQSCSDGTKPPISLIKKRKPFLLFKINDTTSDRNKRSTSCTGSNSNGCCKQPLFISFSEIGWDDWIIQPSGYMANYCKGSCLNEIDRSRYYYSTVIREYITKQKDKAEKLNLTLCCTPSKLSSISLIYREKDNVILTKNLPDMVVEECDCA